MPSIRCNSFETIKCGIARGLDMENDIQFMINMLPRVACILETLGGETFSSGRYG